MSNSTCSCKLEAAVYLVDADTLRCEYANRTAQCDLQYSIAELRELMPRDGEPAFAAESLLPLLAPLRADEEQEIEGETRFRRKDGAIFPVAVRLHLWRGPGKSLLIIIAREITGNIKTPPNRGKEQEEGRTAPMSMGIGEAHPLAIVANSPGMVFQYIQGEDGAHFIPFISDQCINVLGIEVERLKADPALLLDLVLPEDRESLRRSKEQSAVSLAIWNWEGRLWIESYGDVKWVSLRASPRREKGVGVIWEGIIINVTQSRLREKELKESHKRLKEMSAHAMAAREHERIRIAQEIHDDLGGNLTAIKIDLDWLARHIASGGDNLPLLAKVHTVSQMVDRTMHSIQRISRDLRPGIMDFGIVAAIEWEANEFGKRLGVPCEVACTQQDIDLEPDMAVAVFRIFQEALTNITKHARASRVWVRLEMTAGLNQKRGLNQKQLELEVRDNGCGISLTDLRKLDSFGIRGMVERASFLNGKLTVSGGQEGTPGTSVHLAIPLVPVPEPDNMRSVVVELKAPRS
jgi:signal transduction histidine kinase